VPPGEVTVKLTVTAWPTTDDSGVRLVIVVVVLAALRVIVPEVAGVRLPLSNRSV